MPATTRGRRRDAQLAFEALAIEGGLLSPEWLARVAQLGAGGQTEADYRIPRGLNLRDEIGRYWRIAQAHWTDLAKGRAHGGDAQSLATTFVRALLQESFGFASLREREPEQIGGRDYPVRLAALDGRVPVVIAPAGAGLEIPSPAFGDGTRRRSAFGLVQEYLNAADGSRWGVASDGLTLRIARDNASLTRPAWIEADLGRIFTEERYADFAALWLLGHETRFGRSDQPVDECPLERWRVAGREEGTRAREHLRRGVEEALLALGQGFLTYTDNHALRKALQDGSLTRVAYFQELLRLVYRLIFLLTIEERGLLHPDDTPDTSRLLYASGYSMTRLRDRSVRRSAHDRFTDLWEGTKIVFRALATGEPRLGIPALAGIFAAGQCLTLDAARLENRALLLAIFRLAWLREESGLVRVNWRDMGPEELGSVYESLLELDPQITQGGRRFAFAQSGESRGHARKTSGSYYTPDSLVQVLLDSALEPVVQHTMAAHPEDPVAALLQLSIVDPACGSGHFLLAAARRLAAHVARLQANGTPTATEYRHAVRQVVARCIYGVDLNPMAVELCKVSLWMEAVEPGLPLTFLNSHIQQGNSLLGTTPELMANGIPDAAWEPIEGDDKTVARALKKRNRAEAEGQFALSFEPSERTKNEQSAVTAAVTALDGVSDADVATLADKEARWHEILASDAYRHQRLVADAWCAAFVWPKQPGVAEAAPTSEVWRRLRDRDGQPAALTVQLATEVVAQYSFFHWHLVFPQVSARGGFDIVLGNPPWEKIHLRDEEFFSTHRPDIANAPTKAVRKKLIDNLKIDDPSLSALYETTQREHDGLSAFFRRSGLFPLTGVSRINLYSLFCETAARLLNGRGRFGLVLPSGILTDDNNKALLEQLVTSKRLVHGWDFENSEGIFPGVHRSYKFCLFCGGGRHVEVPVADFAFYLDRLAQLKNEERHFSLSAEDLRVLNPNTGNCPAFRTRRDAVLNLQVYRRISPVCTAPQQSDWPGTIKTPFNSANDSGLFLSLEAVRAKSDRLDRFNSVTLDDEVWLPVVEPKFVQQFNHRYAEALDDGSIGKLTDADLMRPDRVTMPRYWLPATILNERFPGNWHLLVRNVTGALNERTSIAAVIPGLPAVDGNLITEISAEAAILICANMNSFAYDYFARQKIAGIHFNQFIWKQLPLIPPATVREWCRATCSDQEWAKDRVLELTYTAWDLESFGRDVGYDGAPFRWDSERRFLLQAEVDAAFFHVYGLSRDDTAYVMDTFPAFRRSDQRAYNEYRTKNIVLEIYDAMAESTRTGRPYVTRLDPPPADPRVAHPDTRVQAT
jgi:hypothetical protein